MKATLYSVLPLFALNLVPFFGVALLRWRVADTLFYFWFETAVIGLLSILLMARAWRLGGSDDPAARDFILSSVGFFVVYLAIHLTLLVAIFEPRLSVGTIAVTAIAIIGLHVVYFVPEFRAVAVATQPPEMTSLFFPTFLRVVIVNIVIFVGAAVGHGVLKRPDAGYMIVFVLLKMVYDIGARLHWFR